jgi:hypothetical protein
MVHVKAISVYLIVGTGAILSQKKRCLDRNFRIQISHVTACANMSSQNKQINTNKQIKNKKP